VRCLGHRHPRGVSAVKDQLDRLALSGRTMFNPLMARLAKRRAEAKEALEHARVERAGRPAKPSHQVKIGEELLIHFASRDVRVRVTAIPEKVGPRLRPEDLYVIVADERVD